jgi:hypothetical protein
MDQYDRHSRRRLMEKVVEHRLASAERDREQARLMGYPDEGTRIRRPLLVLVVIIVFTTLVVVALASIVGPADERQPETLRLGWGTVTHDVTLVEPAVWWSPEP